MMEFFYIAVPFVFAGLALRIFYWLEKSDTDEGVQKTYTLGKMKVGLPVFEEDRNE